MVAAGPPGPSGIGYGYPGPSGLQGGLGLPGAPGAAGEPLYRVRQGFNSKKISGCGVCVLLSELLTHV